MARTYTRDDVETHSDGFRPGRPAVNVKVYGALAQGFRAFQEDEDVDPRFTLEWIEENVSEDALNAIFWHVCETELEYLTAYATEDEDAIFPADTYGKVQVYREGRSARWRKFERVARQIAGGVMLNVVSSVYLNEWETAEQERHEDAGVALDIAEALA